MSAGASLPRAYSVPQLRIILWCGNLIDEISHVFRRGLGRGRRRDAVQCTTCSNSRWRSRRPGWSVRLRVAVLRCPRPIGRRPVRMQQLRCSSWLGFLHQLASEHAPPLLLGVVLCRPPATATRWRPRADRRARWGGGTWHHPPRHPRRRKSLFWQTAACMIRYGRWPGPSVPPPGCPVCPGPLMDKYQRFFFCPTSRAPPSCACPGNSFTRR